MRMEGTGWVLRGRGLSRRAGKPWFHGLCSGLRPRRATRAGPGYVPGLSLCTQAQGSADHSGHSRVASRPGQWGRARGHQGCSRCPSPCCCLSVTPPALDVGAQRYLHAPKGTGTKVVGHRDTYSPPSPGCRMRARVGGGGWAWDHHLKLTLQPPGPEGQGHPLRLNPSRVQWGPTSEAAARLFSRGKRGPLVRQAALDIPRVLPRVLPCAGGFSLTVCVRGAAGGSCPPRGPGGVTLAPRRAGGLLL